MEHQYWSKISRNSVKSRGQKSFSQSTPQELEVSRRSGLYLLVLITRESIVSISDLVNTPANQRGFLESA